MNLVIELSIWLSNLSVTKYNPKLQRLFLLLTKECCKENVHMADPSNKFNE